jgi:acyl carrier protein/pimeloyl-ACP methyl ester carboxylesterase
MELLVSHVEYLGLRLPRCLRVVYMSGDWIPVTLPARIRAVSDREDIRIISMGGATEASIWSNMFELTSDSAGDSGDSGIPEGWSSIPYGRPMRNQRMYVLNERMEHCEAWVTGSIFIGGVGVAHGYYRNPERTAYQFVRHPSTGESLFRTGDLGRVRPGGGGQIEILGREDSQVKVNGFRIELGEIERVLTQHEGVASAALAVHNNTLCAYLVLRAEGSQAPEEVFAALRGDCKVRLAEYMVPKHFMVIDEIPLSPNGKVQRDKLPSPLLQLAAQSGSGAADCVASRTAVEAQVRAVFCKVLGVPEAGICCEQHTFFDLGGNSLSAIQLIFALRDCFGVSVGVQDLFRAPSVAGVSALVGAGAGERAGALVEQLRLNEGRAGQVPIVLFNPAGASGLCYLPLVASMNSGRPVFALDDGVMTSGRTFPFASIEEVAACCLPMVRKIAQSHGGGEVLLMGWSYGGVVASAVAKMLAAPLPPSEEDQEQSEEDQVQEQDGQDGGGDGAPVRVRALVMFDAPLRAPQVQPGTQAPAQRQPPQKDLAVAQGVTREGGGEGAGGPASVDLAQLTQRHFDACTSLLRQYHQRAPEQEPLTCPVLDVRPAQTDYDCGEGAARELTSGPVTRMVVPGCHWTMLFDENVIVVAELLRTSM